MQEYDDYILSLVTASNAKSGDPVEPKENPYSFDNLMGAMNDGIIAIFFVTFVFGAIKVFLQSELFASLAASVNM